MQQTRQQQQQLRYFILKHKQCCLSNIMLWNLVMTPQKNRSYQVKTESKSNFIAHTHCKRSQIKCIRANLLLHSIKFYRLNHHSLTYQPHTFCMQNIHTRASSELIVMLFLFQFICFTWKCMRVTCLVLIE